MFRISAGLALSGLLFLTACSKKSDSPNQDSAPPPDPVAAEKANRDRAIASLKTHRTEDAAWDLAVLSDTDKEVVPALVELLKDKTNAGLGRRLPEKYSSVREGTVQALVWCGDPGIEALKSRGYAILREGLNDTAPAVREHTILAIAMLKDLGKPLAGDVFKLCTDSNEKVRGVAFDTLQKIGIPDALAMVRLLPHADPDVRRLASEAVLSLEEVPETALEPLIRLFHHEDGAVQTAVVRALSVLGPKAAPAVPLALKVIRQLYTNPDINPEGEEYPYWAILMRVGEPAVPALQELLKGRHPTAQRVAALTLGQIGLPAKDAEADLKAVLMGTDAGLVFTAAVALCRIGTGEDEAVAAVMRGLDNGDDIVVSNAIDTIPYMGKAGTSLIPKALAKASSEMPFTRRSALELAVQLGPAGADAAEALGKASAEGDDLQLRQRYINALGAMGPVAKPALESVFKIARDREETLDLRRAALNASVAIAGDSPATIEALKSAAADPDAEFKASAAVAMGQIKPMPPAVTATLTSLIAKDKPIAVRRAAVRSLALASPPAASAKPDLEALSRASKDDLGFWARFALANIDGQPAPRAALVRDGLKDRQPRVRAAALECLPRLGEANKSDLAVLVRMFRDISPVVRASAAAEVARHGPAAKEAVVPLIGLLLDQSIEVQNAAVAALAAIGPDAVPAVPRLKRLLKIGDESTVFAAQIAIAKIQPAEAQGMPKK